MTFTPVFYEKFGKAAKDLLDDKKYDLKKELSLKTTTKDGITFTSSTKLCPCGKDEVRACSSLKVETALPKLGNLEVETNTGNLFSASLETSEVAPGLTSKFSARYDRNDFKGGYVHDCDASVQAIYRKDRVAAKLQLDLQNPYVEHSNAASAHPSKPYELGVSGEAAFAVGHGLSVGGEAGFATKKNKGLHTYNLGVAYFVSDAAATFKTANKFETFQFSYHHQVLPKCQVAGDITLGVNFSENAAKEKSLDISKSFGIALLHDVSRDSSVKNKLGMHHGNLTLSSLFATKLNDNAKISFSSSVDVLKMTGGCHTFGVKLELGSV